MFEFLEQSSSDKSDWAAKPTQSSCVQRITREGSILIKEPVSTTQVSSGRLESSTALKGTEKFLPRPGIEPGLLDCRSSVLTTILPRAWYFSRAIPSIHYDYSYNHPPTSLIGLPSPHSQAVYSASPVRGAF